MLSSKVVSTGKKGGGKKKEVVYLNTDKTCDTVAIETKIYFVQPKKIVGSPLFQTDFAIGPIENIQCPSE